MRTVRVHIPFGCVSDLYQFTIIIIDPPTHIFVDLRVIRGHLLD